MKFQFNITQDDITPRLSPYNGQETSYYVFIDGEKETAGIDENVPGQSGISFREWHGFYKTIDIVQTDGSIQSYPDAADLEECLHSDEAQALIQRICDGIDINWDGSNNRATYNDDADAAAEELAQLIADLDAYQYVTWAADDWLQNDNAASYGITAATTDDELSTIAQTIVTDAMSGMGDYNHIILDEDDILDILTGWRDDLKAEMEDE